MGWQDEFIANVQKPLRDENERLTKERDTALTNADAVYARLMPEVERLRADKAAALRLAMSYDDDNDRLRTAIKEFADAVEKHAFDIKPPCPQTPILVMMAQTARQIACGHQQPVSLAEIREPDERRKNAEAKAALDAISSHQQNAESK